MIVRKVFLLRAGLKSRKRPFVLIAELDDISTPLPKYVIEHFDGYFSPSEAVWTPPLGLPISQMVPDEQCETFINGWEVLRSIALKKLPEAGKKEHFYIDMKPEDGLPAKGLQAECNVHLEKQS